MQENANEHGVRLANYVAGRIESHSMDAAIVSTTFLELFIVEYAHDMAEHGAAQEEVVAWGRAVESAFNLRLSELVGLTASADPEVIVLGAVFSGK
jgi:hypothetical protein